METTQYITLHSQDGRPSLDPGFLRFGIDSNLRHVSHVEWLTMEVEPPPSEDRVVILEGNSRLHFSEGLDHFCAKLPLGEYTEADLLSALAAAMACASCVTGTGPSSLSRRPHNTYACRKQSGRVVISAVGVGGSSSNPGSPTLVRPFAVHVFDNVVKVRGLRPLNSMEAHVSFWWPGAAEPMAKGSVIEVCRPGQQPFVAQVLYAAGTAIMIRAFHALMPSVDVVEHDEWRIRPLGTTANMKSGLPRLLGLGMVDLVSWKPLRVVQSCLLPPPQEQQQQQQQQHRMLVGLQSPHGLMAGDRVQLDGYGESFLNGKEARVVASDVSDHHVEVAVDTCVVGQVPSGQALRFMVPCVAAEVDVVVDRVADVTMEGPVLLVHVEVRCDEPIVAVALRKDEWYPVRMLPPVPSVDWAASDAVHCRWGGGTSLVFSLQFRNAVGPETVVTRDAVVGPFKMALFHQRHVLLMRLRLGQHEGCGVVSLQPNNRRVFGRAQMRQGGFLTSAESACVGSCWFQPPLERVPYLEVAFLTYEGEVLPPGVLGAYSLLLKCQTAS